MTTAKVCDFGASKFMSNNTMTAHIGTLLYMAPEAMKSERGESYTEKGDVYSFGVIMYELFFERLPYSSPDESLGNAYSNMMNLGMHVIDGLRPTIFDMQYTSQEQEYLRVMKQCWATDLEARPTMADVFQDLCEVLEM
jgi:serine/threonine protein kinase